MQKDMVQLPNPVTKRWTRINTKTGAVAYKKSLGAYANVRIHDEVQCDCTHKKIKHFNGEGQCRECACTWFHPEEKYCEKRERISFMIKGKAREGEPKPKSKRVSFIARR